MLAAKNLIEEKHYDVEKVGEEKEYFESGTLDDNKSETK